MAIAWVENTGQREITVGGSSSIVTSSSVAVTTGNAIVVCVQTIDTAAYRTVSGVTDTAGNTYNLCGSRFQNFYASTYYINTEVWVALNITGHASNLVTASFAATNGGSKILTGSWSGMATSGAYDTGYDPAGNVDSASPYTTTADSTAENNELVIGFYMSLVGTDHTASSSSPSVLRYDDAAGANCIADNAAASAGSFSVSVATDVNEAHFCIARAFKQAAAAGRATKNTRSNPLGIYAGMNLRM